MDLSGVPRDKLERFKAGLAELKKREERNACEERLSTFVKHAWHSIESSEYQDSWAIDALCDHLTGVTMGHIPRLLINFPPRCGKSNVASICWPAWVWARKEKSFWSGPGVRFLCGSYNHDLSLQLSNKGRRLLASPWFQNNWSRHVVLRADQNAKSQYDTTDGGSRIATSVGGSLIGIGGDVLLVDDPHNTEAVESEAERETVLNWWRELSSTRLNDPNRSAIVVIMQRLHQEDVSGVILNGPDARDWTHLMLPMQYDTGRHCVTVLKYDEEGNPEESWEDPRSEEGELLWPERYGLEKVKLLSSKLGPYMASGRLQQSPQPKGGGIIKREWWQLWESSDGKFPAMEYVVASADTAFTEKEENDPTGFVVVGVWRDANKFAKVMLMNAWRKRLELHGREVPKIPDETQAAYEKRAMPEWGLCEWVSRDCRKFRVDKLLVENKASGIDVANEIRRLYSNEDWSVVTQNPEGDKVARAYAQQSIFSNGLIYAPDREWAELVIAETEVFNKGRYKDLTDALTQALKHLREIGILKLPGEERAEESFRARYRKPLSPLYPS